MLIKLAKVWTYLFIEKIRVERVSNWEVCCLKTVLRSYMSVRLASVIVQVLSSKAIKAFTCPIPLASKENDEIYSKLTICYLDGLRDC